MYMYICTLYMYDGYCFQVKIVLKIMCRKAEHRTVENVLLFLFRFAALPFHVLRSTRSAARSSGLSLSAFVVCARECTFYA